MASALPCRAEVPAIAGTRVSSPPTLTVISSHQKFDARFLDRRMRQHREYQQQLAAEGAADIVTEVVEAIQMCQQVRAGRGPGKIARLK